MKRFLVLFEKSKDGYNAYIPDLPGCVAGGRTKAETEELIYEAIKMHLELMEADGEPIPCSELESETMIFA